MNIDCGQKGRQIVSLFWADTKRIFAAFDDGSMVSFDCSQVEANAPIANVGVDLPEEKLVSLHMYSDKLIAVTNDRIIVNGNPINISFSKGEHITSSSIQSSSGLLFIATQQAIFIMNFRHDGSYEDSATRGELVATNFGTIQSVALHPNLPIVALILKDKTIRVMNIRFHNDEGKLFKVEQRHRLHDVVNRWPWSEVGFSHDGELVWGTFSEKGRHLVYIWDAGSGVLVRTLEGPKEDLSLALWDPHRPSIITCGAYGTLYRWIPDYPAKWSALIPGLQEIDENVVYKEREDEFDLNTEMVNTSENRNSGIADDSIIDVLSGKLAHIEKIPLFL